MATQNALHGRLETLLRDDPILEDAILDALERAADQLDLDESDAEMALGANVTLTLA